MWSQWFARLTEGHQWLHGAGLPQISSGPCPSITLRLLAGSPCIDAGDNAALPKDAYDLDNDGSLIDRMPVDNDGRPRQVDDPGAADTGNPAGDQAVVDMGAYEYRPLSGDGDGDRDVDGADLHSFLSSMGSSLGDPHYNAASDLNGDGVVDAVDLSLFAAVFGGKEQLGLTAYYSNGIRMFEGPIRHGYSHDCGGTANNIYQNQCTPVSQLPVNWAWGAFDVSWSGYLFVPVTGNYRFGGWVDGRVYVDVNGSVIADFNSLGSGYSGSVMLQKGTWVPLNMNFSSNGGSNNMALYWKVPESSNALVPRDYLSPYPR